MMEDFKLYVKFTQGTRLNRYIVQVKYTFIHDCVGVPHTYTVVCTRIWSTLSGHLENTRTKQSFSNKAYRPFALMK